MVETGHKRTIMPIQPSPTIDDGLWAEVLPLTGQNPGARMGGMKSAATQAPAPPIGTPARNSRTLQLLTKALGYPEGSPEEYQAFVQYLDALRDEHAE